MGSAVGASGGGPDGAPGFCTAINCMDGRVQLPVISHLQARFGAEYVDVVTAAGPAAALCEPERRAEAELIRERVMVSIEQHQSCGLAVVAHHDCAGNPVGADTQQGQLRACLALLRDEYPAMPVVALWVDEQWQVREIE